MSTPALFKTKAATIAAACEQYLSLHAARLDDEFYYSSLPLCVTDAVYSIGVRYEGVQNVVKRYCDYFSIWQMVRPPDRLPPEGEQQPLSELVARMEELGIEKFTEDVFQNRQRTSPRGGILKSDAVLRFARVLQKHGVNFLQDIPSVVSDEALNAALRQIPGQGSGISIRYFFMLAGVEHLIKPDRWILSFLTRWLGASPTPEEAQSLLSETCQLLQPRYPQLTPGLLDNLIWKYERRRSRV